MEDASEEGKPRTNSEIRQWYLERVANIKELDQVWIRRGLSTRERAERAWRIRSEARRAARSMMPDKRERELLRARDMKKYGSPNGPSFEILMAHLRGAGLEGDDAYQAIIAGSFRTDRELNRLLGL